MPSKQPTRRGAVFQFEIDRPRWAGTNENDFATEFSYSKETPMMRVRLMARTAVNDVIRNGGTFVLIANKDTITMVQRPEGAEDDEDDAQTPPSTAAEDEAAERGQVQDQSQQPERPDGQHPEQADTGSVT